MKRFASFSYLFPLFMMIFLVGCEEKNVVDIENNSPLVGTTYKSVGEDWETFSFSEDRYERTNQSWQEAGIQWLGYYSLKDDTIYCYYDMLPLTVEFTMTYNVDSIIKGDVVYYKQP